MNNFAFLLVNYNNLYDTNRCIESIRKQVTAGTKVEIFIYDNSPSLGKYPKGVKVFGTGENIGFAKACNLLAIEAAKTSQNLVFLNNDTELGPDFIKTLFKIKAKLEGKIAVCPLIYDENKHIWFSGGIFRKNICRPETSQLSIDTPMASQFLTGCCIIISSKNWINSGGFDENFFLYYEDVDWSIRVKDILSLEVDPSLKITHYSHSTTGHARGPIQTYFQTRNNLYLAKKLHKLHFNIPYMILLSVKRIINLCFLPSPQKKLTLKMLFLAWIDFVKNQYGKGSFVQN